MKSNHRIRRMQRHNRLRARAVHLNLVSLIDVFAVLVFFLLLSASLAADRLNTLGLDLPSSDQPTLDTTPPKYLKVTIRLDQLVVEDKNGSQTALPNNGGAHDLAGMASALVKIKKSALKDDQITLLVEQNVPYELLVQVMDASRTAPEGVVFESGSRDMFPLISIGDAQPAAAAAAGAAP